jgi:protocatechuate 3,4-dioxygenase beta subunit
VAAQENYLRGVQEADDDGVVTFHSIFPGCYSGRWPHIHYEVYESLDAATVFRDGATLELPEVSGSLEAGYTITLRVAVGV